MRLTLLACAAAFAAASLAAPAIAQMPGLAPGHDATVQLAAGTKHKVKHDRSASGQIACLKGGCVRIPPQCHPEIG